MAASSPDVRAQYERFPYPPIPWFALPQGRDLESLRAPSTARTILVAGCGTFELVAIARANPDAKLIVGIDLSRASLRRLRLRLGMERWRSLTRARRLPPVRLICGDLMQTPFSMRFDAIYASNVLHHLHDPAAGFATLTRLLPLGGWLRLVTYPKASREAMRRTRQYLESQGLSPVTPRLVSAAIQAVLKLPAGDPIRECFLSHPERHTQTGVVDAFFHACENPLSPRQWGEAASRTGMVLVREDTREDCRSKSSSPWQALQEMDDRLELVSNPVLWLQKGQPYPYVSFLGDAAAGAGVDSAAAGFAEDRL